jgi:hypothetical protein
MTRGEITVLIRSLNDRIVSCNRSLSGSSSAAKTRKVIDEIKAAKALLKRLAATADGMVIHV